MHLIRSRLYICAELVTLAVLLPLAMLLTNLQALIFPVLWLVALYCMAVRRKTDGARAQTDWNLRAITKTALKPIAVRLVINCALIALVTWVFEPQSLFHFIKTLPWFWALVMVAYPLLSVIAQEVIYRWFFFTRYAEIFPSERAMIFASAVAFGFAHIIFGNWVAPLFTVIGGVVFGVTYVKSRSLALVSLEHALYGNFIFTIGLGHYFFHGGH